MEYRKCAPTIVLLLGLTTNWAHPQATQENEEERIKPVPVVTGYAGVIYQLGTRQTDGGADTDPRLSCSFRRKLAH